MENTATYNNKPWLSRYEKGVPHEISFEDSLLPDFLENSAKRFPDVSALNFEGYRVTYRELHSMVEIFSGNGFQVVSPNGGVQEIGSHHGIKRHPFQIDARTSENDPIILDVLAYLRQPGIFKERFQPCERLVGFKLCT